MYVCHYLAKHVGDCIQKLKNSSDKETGPTIWRVTVKIKMKSKIMFCEMTPKIQVIIVIV